MMSILKRLSIVMVVALAAAGLFVACAPEEDATVDGAAVQDRGSISVAYVEWDREPAHTHLAAEILSRVGYDVRVNSVSNAAMWAAVAAGEVDFHVSAWLPATHTNEWNEYGDRVEDLGAHFEGARLGLVVPAYLDDINTIADLNENGEMFDYTIVGIDPGAGMMQATENAINNDTYGLSSFELLEGSDATMMAALQDAIRNEEAVVVTGWDPHIKFARFDLKLLQDPQEVFGAAETINTIVRGDLQEDQPDLYEFLNTMDWMSINDYINEVMVLASEGMRHEVAAAQVVDENFDAINSALTAGLSMQ